MPDLLEGSSPRTIRFAVSLPHSLLATIGLMCASPEFEGLADWLGEVYGRLPDDLRAELCLLVTFPGRYQRFTAEVIASLPTGAANLSFDGLTTHLEGIPGSDYQIMALQALARGATPAPAPAELLAMPDKPADWAAYLGTIGSEVAPETVKELVRDGDALRIRLLTVLQRFWHEFYATEFEATRPLMEQSVAYHRAQPHSPSFGDAFVEITGRLVPQQIVDLLPKIHTVAFVPSLYVGPYVAFTHHAEHLIIFYNCRSTPAGPTSAGDPALYPPLKALADETRLQILKLLQGRELYAQEIVDQLDISQPAVSRHLNLMAAAGVLNTRREGNTKHYTINGETLVRVADSLRALR
jgi:hypothetical protein